MFEHLKNKRVLVTGPQRSGTTICARMIAHDADLVYIDEDQVGIDNRTLVNDLFATRKGFVLQAPAVSRWCQKIKADVVVFMVRPVEDIIKSQDQIKWACEEIERSKYRGEPGPIAQVKYDYWYNEQKPKIDNHIEVNFKDLEGHPLFVKNRVGFSARQWKRG